MEMHEDDIIEIDDITELATIDPSYLPYTEGGNA